MLAAVLVLLFGAVSSAELCAEPIPGGSGEPAFCRVTGSQRIETPFLEITVDSEALVGVDQDGRRVLIQFTVQQNQAGLRIEVIPLGRVESVENSFPALARYMEGGLSCEPRTFAETVWERCVDEIRSESVLYQHYFLRTGTELYYVHRYAGGFGLPMDPVIGRMLESIVATASQDARVEDLFPGVALSKPLPSTESDLYAANYSRISVRGRELIALVYYQSYPEGSTDRATRYALLESAGQSYEVLLESPASDTGRFTYEEPFLYQIAGTDLIAFSQCYRGCRYSFFLMEGTPSPVSLEPYEGLPENEHFEGRADVYRFEESRLVVSRKVSRSGDPSCCPSGGAIDISYVLEEDRFRISEFARSE